MECSGIAKRVDVVRPKSVMVSEHRSPRGANMEEIGGTTVPPSYGMIYTVV